MFFRWWVAELRDLLPASLKERVYDKLEGEELRIPFKLVTKDDPRVTRVGRFIRKTSIDELPQLWNVFIGDMSLVGPRPPIAYEIEEYQPWHMERLKAVPGLTGLWQVSGRSSVSFEEMVRLDVRYINTWSPWEDFKILLKTIPVVLQGTGGF